MLRSKYFSRLIRGVAHQRFALLRDNDGGFFVPPPGTEWNPTSKERSLCDSFIFFVAAEIENYFEDILIEITDFYIEISLKLPISSIKSHKEFHESLVRKKKDIAKNNNTRWDKTIHHWEFLGIKKTSFPEDFWDHVDAITTYRGDLAHKSVGMRKAVDPRIIFSHIAKLGPLIVEFDRRHLEMKRRQKDFLQSISDVNCNYVHETVAEADVS